MGRDQLAGILNTVPRDWPKVGSSIKGHEKG